MKGFSKRCFKKVLAAAMAVCLLTVNSMAAYAQTNTGITDQQLSDMLAAVQEMTANLEELGFTMEDVVDLFSISGNVAEQDIQLMYEMIELQNTVPMALYDYDGNPPADQAEQNRRLCNVYSIARNNPSRYYEGTINDANEFGDYVAYLYISHYIDGPGRAPTANDLPYIISSSDIAAYRTFLNSANLMTLFSALTSFGSACYGDFDYATTVGNISNINSVVLDRIALLYAASNGLYDIDTTIDAFGVICKKVIWYYNQCYADDVNSDTFQKDMENYVKAELSALDFYNDFDEDFVSTLVGIAISVTWSIVTNSLSVLGVFIAALPLFVYAFSSLMEVAVLVNLGYSFSGRYAIRTGIYLDF
ncbi:MAG: hypothetical protein J1E83_13430 [Lachnospiraceae bacterium]|nr:hypothetical protein [Lachnospiraceae bacterium]